MAENVDEHESVCTWPMSRAPIPHGSHGLAPVPLPKLIVAPSLGDRTTTAAWLTFAYSGPARWFRLSAIVLFMASTKKGVGS